LVAVVVMGVRSAEELLCDYCEEQLGQVSVETVAGHKMHPDCYDKWKKDVAATDVPRPRAWGMKAGEA
jgi:hypothetical protein